MRRMSGEGRPVVCVAGLLVIDVCLLAAAPQSQPADAIPVLPYKLVDWPTPPTSAAGVPGAWNFIQVASVAVTARGTILMLHRGAHPIMEFESGGKLVRT